MISRELISFIEVGLFVDDAFLLLLVTGDGTDEAVVKGEDEDGDEAEVEVEVEVKVKLD